jgi:phosphoribosyl-ATP pyrophosphohydrolase/phosphoribosyl-AMP cyclohydrolase
MNIDFDKGNGLVPAVVQDAVTRQVLMVGMMNAEALQHTRESGFVTFFSRSRQCLWMKGESSGNRLRVSRIETDCDRDTLLVHATPEGPVCHTGTDTCFGPSSPTDVLAELAQLIAERRRNPVAGSYTTHLFEQGLGTAARKVGEEATEVVVEALDGPRERLLEESADLVYHLLVLLTARDCSWHQVLEVLQQRRR